MSQKSNIVLVTVATRSIGELEYLLSSAMEHGMYVHVLGMGDSRITQRVRLYHTKVHLFRDFMATGLKEGTIRDNDLIVFLDAYDVIQKGGKDAIMKGWIQAGSPDILVSAETNCSPCDDGHKIGQDMMAKEAGYLGSFKYVNSGTIAGIARSMYRALSTFPELTKKGDDQSMWTQAFLSHQHDMRFLMDRNRDLFAVLYNDDPSANDIITRTAPFLHFNGRKTKKHLAPVFSMLYPKRLKPSTETTFTKSPSVAILSLHDKLIPSNHTVARPSNNNSTTNIFTIDIIVIIILSTVLAAFVTVFVLAYYKKFPSQTKL